MVLLACLMVLAAADARAQSLRGSLSSMDRQNHEAKLHDFTYLRGPSELNRFVSAGLLVPVEGNDDYAVEDVSYEVARPEVRLFIERLSGQYRSACGEALVVTSLTRPLSFRLPNGSPRSVHPTGMAMDLRKPRRRACRSWLESTLLFLEKRGVLDATLERRPPHYHVALFPDEYVAYVASLTGRSAGTVLAEAEEKGTYTVRPQDTLWSISQRFDTTPRELRRANGLTSSTIHPGQVLEIPSIAGVTGASATTVLAEAEEGGTYTVRPQDTLWSISQRYDTTPRELRRANGLTSSTIRPGQVLDIPVGVAERH